MACLEVFAHGDAALFIRPCVNCETNTGCSCDFCLGKDRLPGQRRLPARVQIAARLETGRGHAAGRAHRPTGDRGSPGATVNGKSCRGPRSATPAARATQRNHPLLSTASRQLPADRCKGLTTPADAFTCRLPWTQARFRPWTAFAAGTAPTDEPGPTQQPRHPQRPKTGRPLPPRFLWRQTPAA